MTLDTKIDGSPASIRTVATYLRHSAEPANVALADAAYLQRGRAEAAWTGTASDAFRPHLTTLGQSATAVATQADSVATAVDVLATELAGALADMAQARRVASAGGLRVEGTVVYPPGAAPPAVPQLQADATPSEVSAYNSGMAAIGTYNLACITWDDVVKLAAAAQQRWETACADMAQTWSGNAGNLTGALTDLLTSGAEAAAVAVVAKGAAGRLSLYADAAERYRGHAAANIRDGRLVGSKAHFYDMLDQADDAATKAARAAEDLKAPRVPAALGKGLVGLGVLATGYGIYDDMQHGESGAQAAVSNGAGFLASMGAGAAAGALIGSVVPGPGTAIGLVAGTIIGTGVGIITSGAIDSMWENGVDSLGDVGTAIGDGVDELGDTVGDVGDLAGDAWDAIF